MRKIVVTVIFCTVLVLPAISTAEDNVGPGCGIGTMLFKGSSGFSAHTSAGTTNGSTFNQYLGITSGTLGCDNSSVVSNEYEKKVFIASNIDALAQDMAQGGGTYLQTLAESYNISPEHHETFFKLTQADFPHLLESSHNGTKVLMAALQTTMMKDPILMQYAK